MLVNKIFFFVSILFFPIYVNALSGNVVISCNDSLLNVGDEISCIVKSDNLSDEISSFHAELSLGNELILHNINKDSSWEGDVSGGIIDLYTHINKKENVKFFQFVLKANDVSDTIKTSINLNNIKIGDSKFVETKFESTSFNVDIVAKKVENDNLNNNNNNNDNINNNENNSENNNNENSNIDNSGSNDINSNPNTGNSFIYIIIPLMGLTFLISFIIYKRRVVK